MNALCTAPSRAVRNPTTRGESCGFVDESYGPTRALRAVWAGRWTTLTRCPPACPHSRASRPQAPQDQPPVILTRQHRTTLRGCLHRPFRTTSASHSNPSQHRPRPGSPPILQAHFRMGLDFSDNGGRARRAVPEIGPLTPIGRGDRLHLPGHRSMSRLPVPAHSVPSRPSPHRYLGQEHDRDTVIPATHPFDTAPPVRETRP